jgi:predicted RNA-binding Zn-ribbon protein involved in translation (DUF1610 family)
MSAAERLREASAMQYVCGSCGMTIFGRSIPGGSVIVRIQRDGWLEFSCPSCREGMLEPLGPAPVLPRSKLGLF